MMIIIYTTEKGQCTGKTPTRARLNENNILKLASYVTSAKQKRDQCKAKVGVRDDPSECIGGCKKKKR
jgi:hypothetical protein